MLWDSASGIIQYRRSFPKTNNTPFKITYVYTVTLGDETASVVVASVAASPRLNDVLGINDALAILKHLSKIEPLCYGRVLLYDFYDTGNITIHNALEILKYLARLDNVIE
jgi:hypothetical protein